MAQFSDFAAGDERQAARKAARQARRAAGGSKDDPLRDFLADAPGQAPPLTPQQRRKARKDARRAERRANRDPDNPNANAIDLNPDLKGKTRVDISDFQFDPNLRKGKEARFNTRSEEHTSEPQSR